MILESIRNAMDAGRVDAVASWLASGISDSQFDEFLDVVLRFDRADMAEVIVASRWLEYCKDILFAAIDHQANAIVRSLREDERLWLRHPQTGQGVDEYAASRGIRLDGGLRPGI